MSNERAQVFEGSQIGPEGNTPGTYVAATKRLLATSIRPKIMSENKPTNSRGSRMITGGIQNKEWSEGPIDMETAAYNDLSYVLSMMLGAPDIATIGGGAYGHTFEPANFNGLTPRAYTVESGGFVDAKRTPYWVAKTLSMHGNRSGVSLSGTGIGQKATDGITRTAGTNEIQTASKTGTVSGGTFTVTFKGETTAPIAYGANNATLLAALLLLPNLDTGDIALGGGPINTTPVTITFGGRYLSENVPLMTINSGSLTGGGTYDIVETTPGAHLSEVTNVPIGGSQWDFYVDTASGSLGNTKYTRVFDWTWAINDMYSVIWPGNTSVTSWAEIVDKQPTTSFTFQVEGDTTGMGLLAQLRSGDLIFPRIKCTGPTLGATTYLAQFDQAVVITGISEDEDVDGVYAVTYSGQIAYSSAWGKYLSWYLKTNLASLA